MSVNALKMNTVRTMFIVDIVTADPCVESTPFRCSAWEKMTNENINEKNKNKCQTECRNGGVGHGSKGLLEQVSTEPLPHRRLTATVTAIAVGERFAFLFWFIIR